MKGHKQLTSSNNDNWETPECVLKLVRKVGPIGLDPCTTEANPTRANKFITKEYDGLKWSWQDQGLVYVNPPYSQVRLWASKVAKEANGAETVLLVPARTDTKWFHDSVWNAATGVAICFWRGRLRFAGAPASAPFPSAVIYYGKRIGKFELAFGDVGKVIAL